MHLDMLYMKSVHTVLYIALLDIPFEQPATESISSRERIHVGNVSALDSHSLETRIAMQGLSSYNRIPHPIRLVQAP